MEIQVSRVHEKFFLTVKKVEGVKYYCLADLMEQLDLKGQFGDINEKSLPQINSKICWGVRWVGANIIESIFVEETCVNRLIEQFSGK